MKLIKANYITITYYDYGYWLKKSDIKDIYIGDHDEVFIKNKNLIIVADDEEDYRWFINRLDEKQIPYTMDIKLDKVIFEISHRYFILKET